MYRLTTQVWHALPLSKDDVTAEIGHPSDNDLVSHYKTEISSNLDVILNNVKLN